MDFLVLFLCFGLGRDHRPGGDERDRKPGMPGVVTPAPETDVKAPCYAAVLRVTRMPALVARVMSISRLNLSHLPLVRSETLD